MAKPTPKSVSQFWQTTPLEDMTQVQWESLCDGCGRCCLLKLENVDADEGTADQFIYTSISCKLLDCKTGHCRSYADRISYVPDCLVLTPENLNEQKHWMPETCAYRRLAEGRDLPEWHPLLTGTTDTVQDSGYSVGGWCMSEEYLDDENEVTNHIIAPLHIRGN